MSSTLDQLTPSERKALALWYDSASYEALKHLCQLEIEGLGKDALGSPTHDQTRYYAGQAEMATKIPKAIRELYREEQKNKDLKQKS